MSRFRLTAYVSDSVAERLAMASKRKGFNRSKIVDRALDRFLAGDGSQGNDMSLQRRLDNMSKQQARTERNIAVLLETLGLFVRYYLTVTPPLPKSEQDPARSLGNQRFEVLSPKSASVLRQVKARCATSWNVWPPTIPISSPVILMNRVPMASSFTKTRQNQTLSHQHLLRPDLRDLGVGEKPRRNEDTTLRPVLLTLRRVLRLQS